MTFGELISICNPLSVTGPEPETVNRVIQDSRQAGKGDVFVAISGAQYDGHDFAQTAVDRGARVIIANHTVNIPETACLIIVEETRRILGPIALAAAGHPEKDLYCLGVTGTNGKTTVTTLVYQVLSQLGHKTGLIGTVAKYIGTKKVDGHFTTPDSVELAGDLRMMADAGCEYVIMEVSSHALAQYRTAGITFRGTAFTNLTHDHLDYHHSLEEYASAKKRLFDNLDEEAFAVINDDDPYAPYMISDCKARVVRFGFRQNRSPYKIISNDSHGLILNLDNVRVNSSLVGLFNAYNLTEAYLIACNLGCPEPATEIGKVLGNTRGASGRLERVSVSKISDIPTVFVDYAHTPDALENVASTLSGIRKSGQRLNIVFGCGGNRDTTKRPVMGAIAERYADHVVITSDNPRFEEPSRIMREIAIGLKHPEQAEMIEDRPVAIRKAIAQASANDIVLIAGKGHEDYQEVRGERHHMDDREIARDALDHYPESTNTEAC